VTAFAASAWAGGSVGPVLDDVRKGPPFPRIANCYGAALGHWTKPETLKELAKFDLLIGGVNAGNNDKQRQAVAKMVAQLRARNPHLIVLDFSSSAPYATAWQVKQTPFPDDGWLLTPDGKRIEGCPGTTMINITRRPVIDWLARRSAASVAKPVFDGTFIDCMGGHFDHWACNIQSGKSYEIDADGDGVADKPRGGQLIRGANQATFTSADGRSSVTARSAAPMGLHDERRYGTEAFLLTQGGPRDKLKKGDTWKVELTITPGPK